MLGDGALVHRFTPACAGTWDTAEADAVTYAGSPPRARGHAPVGRTRRLGSPVHPRVRGDMLNGVLKPKADYGSPPRARGHVHPAVARREDGRFTPACAGTCPCFDSLRPAHPVHPRVRGDMEVRVWSWTTKSGSPPRARGHALARRSDRRDERFTPACAGTCAGLMKFEDAVYGSPPRARGHGE